MAIVQRPASAGILDKSMGARNRVGIGLSYQPARLHRLVESIPRNRFLGSLKVYKFGLRRVNRKKSERREDLTLNI